MGESAARVVNREQELETIQYLRETGFQVIIYGGGDGPAVREAAGFTEDPPVVILDREADVEIHRRKIALMASGAEEDEAFARFVNRFIAQNMARIYELRVINGRRAELGEPPPGSQGTGRTHGTASRRKPV